MRRKQTERDVRTITTGHAEADMLGQVYLWLSERTNRKHAQRPHRTYRKTRKYTINELYIRGLFRANHRVVSNGAYGVLTQYQRLLA